jgi:hypothetical protein
MLVSDQLERKVLCRLTALLRTLPTAFTLNLPLSISDRLSRSIFAMSSMDSEVLLT